MPALHISLGTFLKLFNLLEQDCLILDVKLVGQNALKDKSISQSEYDEHVEAYKNMREIEKTIESCEEKINLVIEAIALNVFCTPCHVLPSVYMFV